MMKVESLPCLTYHFACPCVLERIRKLEAALHGLLLSADCTWEERGEGHDWPEACQVARKALEVPADV